PEVIPVKFTTRAPESSLIAMGASGSSVGGSFTELTVSVQVVLAETPSLSVRVKVRTALPNWLGKGVTVNVRGLPVPVTSRFELGMRAGFAELAATTRLFAGVSR